MKKYFILFLLFIVACSTNNVEKEFNNAKTLIGQKKYDEASEILIQIADGENNKFKLQSLVELGNIYRINGIKTISKKESLLKAVDYYKKAQNEYPDSTISKKTLFFAGFILNNELKMYEEARKVYEKYISEYPNDSLVPTVKAEIENLGLTPEQILEKRIKK